MSVEGVADSPSFGEGQFPGKEDIRLMPFAFLVGLYYFAISELSRLVPTRRSSRAKQA